MLAQLGQGVWSSPTFRGLRLMACYKSGLLPAFSVTEREPCSYWALDHQSFSLSLSLSFRVAATGLLAQVSLRACAGGGGRLSQGRDVACVPSWRRQTPALAAAGLEARANKQEDGARKWRRNKARNARGGAVGSEREMYRGRQDSRPYFEATPSPSGASALT